MKPWAQPYAYIRRSVASRADPGDISREFQTEAVRTLAEEDADRLVIIDQDWGRSAATDKTDRRLAFLGLLDKIEAGEVSALFAYSADRLARSVEWSARLLNACRRAGVPIVTTQGRVNPGDEAATLLFHVLAATNEAALSGMEKKARASVERRQARNQAAGLPPNHGMGRKPYGSRPGEDIAKVMAAVEVAPSYAAAARLLNGCPVHCAHDHEHRESVATRDGALWTGTVVARIAQRLDPDAPRGAKRGWTTAKAPRIFTGLLRCPFDGQTLSSMPRHAGVNGQKTDTVGYFCPGGRSLEGHPRPYVVAESKIRPWAEEVLAEVATQYRVSRPKIDGAEVEAHREGLRAKAAGIGDAYAGGAYGVVGSPEAKTEMAKRLAKIDQERARAEEAIRATVTLGDMIAGEFEVNAFPLIDWAAEPDAVNRRLRRLWKAIRMRHYRGRFEPADAEWVEGARDALFGTDEERALERSYEKLDREVSDEEAEAMRHREAQRRAILR